MLVCDVLVRIALIMEPCILKTGVYVFLRVVMCVCVCVCIDNTVDI